LVEYGDRGDEKLVYLLTGEEKLGGYFEGFFDECPSISAATAKKLIRIAEEE
jgi:hypothetical protein